MTDAILAARALVVHDLAARGVDSARTVSIVDDVLSERRWWVEQWPDGAAYVACLVAQDVQEALLDYIGRWPLCTLSHEEVDCDVLVLGDDREATDVVRALADAIPGMRGVYGGRLRNARQIETLTANLIAINRRYKTNSGIRITMA